MVKVNSFFNDRIAFVYAKGYCSHIIEGRMRKDESAVIIPPKYKQDLEEARNVRYYKTASETHDYLIKGYYRDLNRPLTNTLIKPLIVHLDKSE